uniref:Dolichol phosphate-mannose biosynthesis regulatory protein n=1 Tax=Amphimedon queenslandica TaxID=400682 RepID=A0A1X7TYV6_AMPQE
MKSLLLVLSLCICYSVSGEEAERHRQEVEGVLNGTFTFSPYGYLFPLDPIATSLVLVGVFGIIGLLSVLVYWPLPTPKAFSERD